MSVELRVVVALVALLLLRPASADVFLTADILLAAGEAPGSYALGATLPIGVAGDAAPVWPAGCRQDAFERTAHRDGELLLYRASCVRPPRPDDAIETTWRLDAARLRSVPAAAGQVRTLLPGPEGLRIPFAIAATGERGWRQLAPQLLAQGVQHIVQGADHLAFVLCLTMLAGGMTLLALVTAFTLGHSLSLGLAFFGVLRIPAAPTEALIALSIVLVAREALLAGGPARDPRRVARAAAVVTVFGLIHGLGFAAALTELGIAPGERWPALLFFNLGVEIGQLMFVGAVLATFAVLRRLALEAPARRLALGAAGMVGGFWFAQRLAGF